MVKTIRCWWWVAGGGLCDYVNVHPLPSCKLQNLAVAEARNIENAKKH